MDGSQNWKEWIKEFDGNKSTKVAMARRYVKQVRAAFWPYRRCENAYQFSSKAKRMQKKSHAFSSPKVIPSGCCDKILAESDSNSGKVEITYYQGWCTLLKWVWKKLNGQKMLKELREQNIREQNRAVTGADSSSESSDSETPTPSPNEIDPKDFSDVTRLIVDKVREAVYEHSEVLEIL